MSFGHFVADVQRHNTGSTPTAPRSSVPTKIVPRRNADPHSLHNLSPEEVLKEHEGKEGNMRHFTGMLEVEPAALARQPS